MITIMLILFVVVPPQPERIQTALHYSAVVWGHDPDEFWGLAYVESTMQVNPPRMGPKGKPWGDPPEGRRWKYCGLMQTTHYPRRPARSKAAYPPGEWLIAWPELSAFYGAIHLHGWRRWCGEELQYEGWHSGWTGCRGEDGMSFTRKVMRYAKRKGAK
jgi:hypothetical protein